MSGHKKNKQKSIRTLKKIIFDSYTKTKSKSIHHIGMKSISTTQTATKIISSYTEPKSSSMPHTEIMSIWNSHANCK